MGKYGFLDLVLDNGELVRVEYPLKYEDEVLDSVSNDIKTGDWWAPGQWDNCTATYIGVRLERVSMRRVVGTL